jgi:Holliday junction resolvase RusA-like endonuclease
VVTFEVPGDPHGKGRPKFARRGNFVQTYTDAKTVSYEDLVRFHANLAMIDLAPIEGPVAVYIYIKLAVPKSYSKKRTEACLSGLERPTKKPDWDNVAKSICDAMNGIVYQDDTQIVDAYVTKVYAANSGVDVGVKFKGNK